VKDFSLRDEYTLADYGLFSSNGLDDFLQPLQVFRLCGSLISWDSPVLIGLTDLTIHPTYLASEWPNLSDIAAVLAACPELRSLALIGIALSEDLETQVGPTSLSKLEALDL
jgi:hypothetical protein